MQYVKRTCSVESVAQSETTLQNYSNITICQKEITTTLVHVTKNQLLIHAENILQIVWPQYQLLVVLFPNQQPIWSYVTFPIARITYTILHSIRLFIKTSMSRVSNKVSSWAAFMASSSMFKVYVNPFCIILQILFSAAKIMQIIYSIKKNIKKSYLILYCLRLALS